jgi:hypothetical protein
MATIQTVAVGVPRGTQFNARRLSTGTLKTGSSTVKVQYIKQSPVVEYYDGNSWVTSNPGPLSTTEDADVPGVYEHTVTYDAAGVDYIVRCWDAADSDVQQLVGRVHGVQPEEADGVWRVHVTVKETGPGGAPVPDVTASLKNASGNEVGRDTTNSNGEANGLAVAGAGTYAVALAKSTWTFGDESLVVSGSDPSPLTAEYYGSAFDAGNPAAPEMCRVYDWIKEVEEAAPVVGRQVNVELVDSPAAGPPVYYDDENSQATTDANGYFYLDLVRSSSMGSVRVRIYSANENGTPDGAIDRTIRVPDQASAALSTIAEALPA